jgi:serine/threonine protein kinase
MGPGQPGVTTSQRRCAKRVTQCRRVAGNVRRGLANSRSAMGYVPFSMSGSEVRAEQRMGWSDLIGRQLGQYSIVDELGRGGSSRVYRAQDLELSRDVAVKVIFNDAEDRIGFVRRFEREVQAVAQLDHPNIVAVFDRGETDDLVYLVMQCVTGGTLRQRCGRPIPVADAAAAIFQMSMALHHAHQNGIIHRDVKPSNMLVSAVDPRHLLLTDFGIAKLQGMLGLTKSGTTIGTPEYMSPEQAEGKDIDQRTDVYSLGCVLFELLAGRPPFVGSTAVSVLYQQVHLRPPHLRAFNAEVPRELGHIVEQALSKHAEERFGTAELLAEALYAFSEGSLPSLPGLATFPETVSKAIPGADAATASTAKGTTGQLLLRHDPVLAASGPLTPSPLDSFAPITPVGADVRSVLPPTDSVWQPAPSSSGELVPPSPESWEGLGSEGLDAIFPDDPEAQFSHDARADAISNTPTLEEMPLVSPSPSGSLTPPPAAAARPRPASSRELNRSIPLPSFRLPSRESQPLNLGLTGSGALDIEALMAQVESQPRPAPEELESVAETPTEPIARRQAIPDYDTDEMEVLPTAPRIAARPIRRSPAPPDKSGPRPRNHSFLLASAIAALLSILLLVGILVSAFALGSHAHGQTTSPPATAAPTMTALPSPTMTPRRGPTATATLTPQQVDNNEAAAAFASVTLSPFADNSCSQSNQTRQFTQGQTVYIDLCTSGGPFPGPVTVSIRQGGVILHYVVKELNLSPNSSYFYFEQYVLASGSYDMLVTMQINGKLATARDLAFTVS